jgi:hypothetical protein
MAKRKKTVHSFVIDERRWLHNEVEELEEYEGMLRNEKGKMCCLGFFAQSCGVKPKNMKGLGMPADIEPLPRKLKELVLEAQPPQDDDGYEEIVYHPTIQDLADTNDAEGLTLFRRKQRITRLFRDLGVAVTFTNGTK